MGWLQEWIILPNTRLSYNTVTNTISFSILSILYLGIENYLTSYKCKHVMFQFTTIVFAFILDLKNRSPVFQWKTRSAHGVPDCTEETRSEPRFRTGLCQHSIRVRMRVEACGILSVRWFGHPPEQNENPFSDCRGWWLPLPVPSVFPWPHDGEGCTTSQYKGDQGE